jgi:hypothetical protein
MIAQYSDGLQAQQPIFDSRHVQEIFLYSTAFRLALRSTQPPIAWVPEVLFSEVKQLVCEADHSPLFSAEVKNDEAICPLPYVFSWGGA